MEAIRAATITGARSLSSPSAAKPPNREAQVGERGDHDCLDEQSGVWVGGHRR